MDKATRAILKHVIESIKHAKEHIANEEPLQDEMSFLQGKISAYEEIVNIIEDCKEGN